MLQSKRSYEIAQAIAMHRDPKDRRLFLAFDTSGALPFAILEEYHRAVDFSLRSLDIDAIHLMQFDTSVHYAGEYPSGTTCRDLRWRGGGGTMIEPVIEHVGGNNKGKPTRVLVFTDGYFSDLEVPKLAAKWKVEPYLLIMREFGATLPESFKGAII